MPTTAHNRPEAVMFSMEMGDTDLAWNGWFRQSGGIYQKHADGGEHCRGQRLAETDGGSYQDARMAGHIGETPTMNIMQMRAKLRPG